MPKCPKCDENIAFVMYDYIEVGYKRVNPNGREKEWYPPVEFKDEYIGDCERGDFRCPKCGEKLFIEKEDAIKFLKGKKK